MHVTWLKDNHGERRRFLKGDIQRHLQDRVRIGLAACDLDARERAKTMGMGIGQSEIV